jgi:hypothetical protein
MNLLNFENFNYLGVNYRIWLSIIIYLISYVPAMIANFKYIQKGIQQFFGLIFLGCFIGYIVLLSSMGTWALGKIADNNGLGLIYSVILFVTIPLGRKIGEYLVKRELKGEGSKSPESDQLTNVVLNFFIYPLISFAFTFIIMFLALTLKQIFFGNLDLSVGK